MKDMRIQLFCKIVDLLDQLVISKEDTQAFKDHIARLKQGTTNELLAEIKKFLIWKQDQVDKSHSPNNNDYDTVSRLRSVIKKLLAVNGILREKAKEVVDELDPNVLKDMLVKVKLVYENLTAIRKHSHNDLLISFNIKNRKNRRITSFIIDALKKGGFTLSEAEIHFQQQVH